MWVLTTSTFPLPEEEAEDMDTEVDNEDLPHLGGEDEEEVTDCILPDAEDDFEDEAAWKDECDDSLRVTV